MKYNKMSFIKNGFKIIVAEKQPKVDVEKEMNKTHSETIGAH